MAADAGRSARSLAPVSDGQKGTWIRSDIFWEHHRLLHDRSDAGPGKYLRPGKNCGGKDHEKPEAKIFLEKSSTTKKSKTAKAPVRYRNILSGISQKTSFLPLPDTFRMLLDAEARESDPSPPHEFCPFLHGH